MTEDREALDRRGSQNCLRIAAIERDVVPTVMGFPSSASHPATERQRNEAMSQMLEMGFDYNESLRKLELCNWDVKVAVEVISSESGRR